METNLKIGRRYKVSFPSGVTHIVILRRLGNPSHRRPLHMVADVKRPEFTYGVYATEVTFEEIK